MVLCLRERWLLVRKRDNWYSVQVYLGYMLLHGTCANTEDFVWNRLVNFGLWWWWVAYGTSRSLLHRFWWAVLLWPGISQFCWVTIQFSHSVMSNSLQPHESQHTSPPCPSTTPGVHSDSRPLSQWCHPTISFSVVPFSSCPQSLPASESFPMSQLFASGGQSTGISALASFLPKKPQGWSASEWTGWISLQSKGFSRVSPTPQFKSINPSVFSLLHSPTLTSIHDHRKNHSLD